MQFSKQRNLLALLFLFSGAAAIIYQNLWLRILSLVFGGVVLTISIVTATFLLGLALGAFFLGKIADQKKNDDFILYSLCEISIGLVAIANYFLFPRLSAISDPWPFVMAIGGILIHAFVMGGTWPLMFRLLLLFNSSWKMSGLIVFLNTIGGALGSFLAGFFLMANMGLLGTLALGVFLNFVIGLIVLIFYRIAKVPEIKNEEPKEREVLTTSSGKNLTQLVVFIGGFAGMALEIFYTRATGLLLGSSVYAFTLILTIILIGLAFGGLTVNWKLVKPSIKLLATMVGLEAIFVFIGMYLMTRIPSWVLQWTPQTGNHFFNVQIIWFIALSLVVFLPSYFSGTLFPLGVALMKDFRQKAGSVSGYLYFLNTFGSVLGGVFAGLYLLPIIGIKGGFLLMGIILFLTSMIVLLRLDKTRAVLFLIIALIGSYVGYSRWNLWNMGSGAFLYGEEVLKKSSGYKMLSYEDGREGTVVVNSHDGVLSLRINGKVDASNNRDMGTQAIMGHIPMLLHPNPEEVLVVGLGSGVTSGAIAEHKKVKKITTVEIEPAVVRAAEKYFSNENYKVLDNPKMDLVVDDGRHFLLKTTKKFDVISSEPSNPWLSGEANLFTKEFFEIGKGHLNKGGIFFQWLHLYNLRPSEVKSIIKTFQTVFPYAQIWTSTTPSDLFLAGKETPFILDWNRFQEALDNPGVRESLARRDYDDERRLLALLWANKKKSASLSSGAEVNTDGKPILEYRAPFGLFEDTLGVNFDLLLENFEENESVFQIENMPTKDRKAWEVMREARRLMVTSRKFYAKGDIDKALEWAYRGLETDPEAPSAKRYVSTLYVLKAKTEKIEDAQKTLNEAIRLNPEEYRAYEDLAQIYVMVEGASGEEVEAFFRQAKEKFTWSGMFLMCEGILKAKKGETKEAELLFLGAKELEPWNIVILNNLAHFYNISGRKEKALIEWKNSLEIETNQPQIKQFVRGVEGLMKLK